MGIGTFESSRAEVCAHAPVMCQIRELAMKSWRIRLTHEIRIEIEADDSPMSSLSG